MDFALIPSTGTAPVRHFFKFTREEVIEALRAYAISKGHAIPESQENFIWGLEDRPCDRHASEVPPALTLAIVVPTQGESR